MSNISKVLCKPNAFKLQKHQLFLKGKLNLDRLLLFHGIGSGKTCSAISMATSYYEKHGNKQIVVIVPASLRDNFFKELKGPCGNQINHNPLLFDVMSYHGFVKRYKNNTIDIDNTLVIVDEVQNVISQTGNMYKVFLEAFQNMQDSKLICLSATPMFDKPIEIALLGNLLLSKAEFDNYHLPTNPVVFSKMMGENPKVLYTFFKKRISYFRGADPRAYPTKTEHHVDCVMSPFQRDVYMESIGHLNISSHLEKNLQRAFLIAPRQLSNLVLPNANVGKLKDIDESFDVEKHSIKFHTCIKNIKRSPGPVFVYSNFVSVSGIEAFATILSKVHGLKMLRKNEAGTTPKPRFGIFRANQSRENARLLKLFNSPQNKDGSLIKVIIGSPTMKEGVTLLRVRQIHILDPYWNRSRTEQIMGRGVRFCSHADLPIEQRKVDVFHYYAIPSIREAGLSVDLRILQLSNDKIRRINLIETILKETSIDCKKFKDRNEPPTLHCFNHNLVSASERRQLLKLPPDMSQYNASSREQKKTSSVAASSSRESLRVNNNASVEHEVPITKPKPKPKPLQFGKKTGANKAQRAKKPKTTCPSNRRPNAQKECSDTFPFLRKNNKGDLCCFKRAQATTKEREKKTCKPNQILNPKTKRCVFLTTKLGKELLRVYQK